MATQTPESISGQKHTRRSGTPFIFLLFQQFPTSISLLTRKFQQDMPTLDALFTTVESYDKISVQYLQFSKIGKVMRHITLLPDDKVPRDDEFKFRDRAKALVDQWHQVLNANKPNGSESGAAGTTNGAPAPKMEKNGATDEAGVTEAAAAINLNGKGSDGAYLLLFVALTGTS